MCCWTASQGMRRSAPISGGPNGCFPVTVFVKALDELVPAMYRQATLPFREREREREEAPMATSTREEIKVGEMAIRFLIEGEESAGSVAIFEFDVSAGAQVAAAHSHDG